jgi:hypothetical protein
MIPREKAEELVARFRIINYDLDDIDSHKECALIAVDEIFEFMKMDDEYTETVSNANSKWVHYWIEVKKEIKKL